MPDVSIRTPTSRFIRWLRSAKAPDVQFGESGLQAVSTTVTSLAGSLVDLTFEQLPAATRQGAVRCVLDVTACAAAGRADRAADIAARWAETALHGADAAVWFDGRRVSALAAAFVNSMAASVLDLDDGHRLACGHPGAAVIPAVIAAGEAIDARLQDALLAIVCGYEAGVRVAAAREPSLLRSVATGRWSAVAVAAAVGRIRGLSREQLAHAIAIAEAQAPNLLAADHAGFIDSDTKEGIPWSVLTGMAAVDLAELGFRGYRGALDNPAVYRPGAAQGRKSSGFFIETTYFKPYACCRWLHSAIDAVLDMREQGLEASIVDEIHVATFERALTLGNSLRPNDVISAQFSIPFIVALALIDGRDALTPLRSSVLGRTDVIDLAERVVVVRDDRLDQCFPAQTPARVRIQTRAGSFEREVRSPVGDPANPMSDSQLVEKAVRLCAGVWSEAQTRTFAQRLFDSTRTGREDDRLRDLVALLR